MSILSSLMCLLGCKAQNNSDAKFQTVGVTEFEAIVADSAVALLDVRTAEEYAEGHLAKSVNIDVLNSDFEQKALASIPKEKTVALYCRSGRRSKKAASILASNGYKVVELGSGYLGWTGENKPVTKE